MRFLILSVLMFLIFFESNAQKNWELAKEKDGIKVFTRKDVSSKFKSIKVEAILNGTIDKLLKVLMDAGSNKDWVYNTHVSYVIKRLGKYETISYTETSVPWPASNRDIPLHMQLLPDFKQNTLKVIAKGVPDAIPHKEGIVRIPFFNSWWDVKYDGNNKLNIVYFLEMDPGGIVPAWLVNLFIARGPYETFSRLVKVMKQ